MRREAGVGEMVEPAGERRKAALRRRGADMHLGDRPPRARAGSPAAGPGGNGGGTRLQPSASFSWPREAGSGKSSAAGAEAIAHRPATTPGHGAFEEALAGRRHRRAAVLRAHELDLLALGAQRRKVVPSGPGVAPKRLPCPDATPASSRFGIPDDERAGGELHGLARARPPRLHARSAVSTIAFQPSFLPSGTRNSTS